MRILIVEDEALIAQRIERLTREILGNELQQLTIKPTLESASLFADEYPIDLMILDLNLNGKDGFQLLEKSVAQSFQTMILSANTDLAIQAYDYGVLDFIAKPFNKTRLEKAFQRYSNQNYRAEYPTKYLAVKKNQKMQLVDIEEIVFIKGAGNYGELNLKDGKRELHDKSLQHLEKLLPSHFERIHKSFIVNLKMVDSISTKYEVVLKNGEIIPIGRAIYKRVKNLLS
ncbi:MAG: two-component system response regulator LytT [Saprospiraceae bacterium]|jgi:two-component system response regulator LytT